MPRPHFVKKARVDNPVAKKGESYWWWKFPFRGKSYSKTRPTPSQLTQSEFLGAMYDHQDTFNNMVVDADGLDGLASELNDLASEVREIGEECAGKKDNMPESLQEGDTGQLLEERSQQCETIADSLEDAASTIEDLDGDEDKDNDDKVLEAESAKDGIDWTFE
jgi:hypothetical protein